MRAVEFIDPQAVAPLEQPVSMEQWWLERFLYDRQDR
jgi:hypothetical protein